ncbi:hypothetical protein OHC33_001788 [Knufia fluminis]|uniref:Uncharacterized protein n=1 Tax=Knufia fluminis TaxID=191047 RepID=A0AAN8EK05_9EURO|nr:hypothetical protein OHC33_001788 [Knufia fluminis]
MATITQGDIINLQRFHQQHFSGQRVPNIQAETRSHSETLAEGQSGDLGYYEDGVRRTLTDEQIAMFRHSEIQRLLAERRRQRELREEQQEKEERLIELRKHRIQDNPSSTTFETDHSIHSRSNVAELSYDDNHVSRQNAKEPKTFHWPQLGS